MDSLLTVKQEGEEESSSLLSTPTSSSYSSSRLPTSTRASSIEQEICEPGPSVSITGKREFEGRSSRSRTKKVKLEEGEDEVKQEVKEELQEGLSNSSNGKKGKSKVKVENQEDIKVKLEEKDWQETNPDHLVNAFVVPSTRLPSFEFPVEYKKYIFSRKHLAGEQQSTCSFPHVPSRKDFGYKTSRLTLDQARNFVPLQNQDGSPREEGLPIIMATGILAARMIEACKKNDHLLTVFVRVESGWKYYGQYEITAHRKARDGEFESLSEEEKEVVLDVYYKYHVAKENNLGHWGFRSTGNLKTIAAVKAQLREDLTRNWGVNQATRLRVGYCLLEFRGCDLDKKELDDIKSRAGF